MNLHDTTDAQVWAEEFCRINPIADKGSMIGWFANAIMAGYDTGKREKPVPAWEPTPGEYCAFWDDESLYFSVLRFTKIHGNCFEDCNGFDWNHVARIAGVDCACSVEELKARTDWL